MPEFRQPLGLKYFFAKFANLMFNAAGVEIKQLAENDGTARSQLIGYDGTNQQRICTTTDGVLKIHLFTNPQVVDPQKIPAAEGIVYNPGSTATEIYEFWFMVTNETTGEEDFSIGVDVGAGGTLAGGEYIQKDFVVPANGTTDWFPYGPKGFRIAGDDDVRAVASTADTLTLHMAVDRLK